MEQNTPLSLFPCCPIYRTEEGCTASRILRKYQDWQSWISCQEFSASDGTKKAQRSSTILHTLPVHRRAICFCLPAHAGSCGERKQQLRWQLTSVSRPRKFSPCYHEPISQIQKEYLVRIRLCDQGDIGNLSVNVFCSLSFSCCGVPPNSCPFLCLWVTENFGYRSLFGNQPNLQKGFKISTPHCGFWLNDEQICIDQNLTFWFWNSIYLSRSSNLCCYLFPCILLGSFFSTRTPCFLSFFPFSTT